VGKPLNQYFVATGAWFLAYGMQTVIFAWLVTMVLDETPDKVGLAQMAYLLPGTLFILIGGSIADQYGGRKIALIGQTLAALVAAGLALSMTLSALTYEKFLLFAICMGCAQAILTPARDGLLPLVAEGKIQQRVAQVSLIQFGVQMVGIMIASLADALGAVIMLSIQSVILSLGALAYQLLNVRLVKSNRTQPGFLQQIFSSVYEGFISVRNSRAMRAIVFQNVAMGICFMGSYIVTIPLLIREVYQGSSTEMSIVNAANSLGLFLTIMILLRFGEIVRQGRALLLAQGLGALVLTAASMDLSFYLLTSTLFVWGMCGGIAMTMARTIMQEHSPEDQRSRMMAFYAFSFMGAGPLGALVTGYLVTWVGPSSALAIASLTMLLVVILVRIRSNLWQLER
jgi:MFS family permease